jgi:hypothetical protein
VERMIKPKQPKIKMKMIEYCRNFTGVFYHQNFTKA